VIRQQADRISDNRKKCCRRDDYKDCAYSSHGIHLSSSMFKKYPLPSKAMHLSYYKPSVNPKSSLVTDLPPVPVADDDESDAEAPAKYGATNS